MNDADLLTKVKTGLSVDGALDDNNLTIKMLAAKQYILNAGVSEAQLNTDLGIATLTIGVNDLWNLLSGEVKFSPAFNMLVTQLQAVSLP